MPNRTADAIWWLRHLSSLLANKVKPNERPAAPLGESKVDETGNRAAVAARNLVQPKAAGGIFANGQTAERAVIALARQPYYYSPSRGFPIERRPSCPASNPAVNTTRRTPHTAAPRPKQIKITLAHSKPRHARCETLIDIFLLSALRYISTPIR